MIVFTYIWNISSTSTVLLPFFYFFPLASICVCVCVCPITLISATINIPAIYLSHSITPVFCLLSVLFFQCVQFEGPYVAYCEALAQSEWRKTHGANTGARATHATGTRKSTNLCILTSVCWMFFPEIFRSDRQWNGGRGEYGASKRIRKREAL